MSIKAVVVGGTNGIGYAMACQLAATAKNSTVIISGRTKPANIPFPNIEFRQLDATSMRKIKQYTDTIKSVEGQKLGMLIMTQSYMNLDGRTETPEGIDAKMALHHYGRQLLIRELTPVLEEDGKVISVYDSKYGNPDKILWEDLDLKHNYALGRTANHGMVMTDAMVQWHAAEQKRNGGPARYFVHAWPGAVKTSLHKEMQWYLKPLLRGLSSIFGVSADTAATRLLKGTMDRAEADVAGGKFWTCIDNHGQEVKDKKIWSEEELDKIASHTWGLVDSALKTPA
ncbi:hypothetical protein B0I35DRAFT_109696 [Stachybotrys elegans]|uniref:Uncharacterized protein n=1 Tax=Stachybotrys elegans TaxID=80388 RepID=A0A8K0WKI3_9HYPO|nr:hypothetical protein B0I35DRAFT_109696 [Stachybotrys elegans]